MKGRWSSVNRAMRAERDKRVCAAYRRGETSIVIAMREGMTECGVRDLLRRCGVELRKGSFPFRGKNGTGIDPEFDE